MARGGGGGGHSGGGSHSDGGRSGGGGRSHSSGGFGGSSYRGGGPGPHYYGGPGYPPPRRPVRYRRNTGCGCGSVFSTIFVFIIIAVVLMSMLPSACAVSCAGSVTRSTEKREKIDRKYVDYMNEWYDDDLGWFGRHNNELIDGLETFYEETGIQPYIALVEYGKCEMTAEAEEAYAENLYEETFSDEGHLLFVYFACENDRQDLMDGDWYYICGYDTETVMDSEAKEILESYFRYFYDDTSLDVDELFANTFAKSGKEIMSGPIYMRTVVIVIVAIVAVVIIVIVLTKWWKARTKRKNKEQEDLEKMLSKPLETFGSDPVDDLKNKYDNK